MANNDSQSDAHWSTGQGIPGVVTIGDPRLRQIAESCTDIPALAPLCDELVTRVRAYKGAGLAASQIGRPERLAVVEVRKTELFPDRPESPLYVMINPQVIAKSEEQELGWEGCFSIPGMMAKVSRSTSIEVTWIDPSGEQHREHFNGYLARVMQQEIDHLNGVLFTDLMDPSTLTTVENWKTFCQK